MPSALPLYAAAVVLGLVHGADPGHGWPVAATYALDKPRRAFHAVAASVLLGVGHLVSSIAVVVAYVLALSYFDLAGASAPVTVAGVAIGTPVGIVAGTLLVALGVREYRRGGHGGGDDRAPTQGDHAHSPVDDAHERSRGHDRLHGDRPHGDRPHDDHLHGDHPHDAEAPGPWARVKRALPFAGGHEHLAPEDADARGLAGIVATAFLLGFAHEEEIEIIGFCTGARDLCLPLMLAYGIAVLAALVTLTLVLVVWVERYEDSARAYAEHLPTLSAAVLVATGLGFVFGLL